MWPAVGEQVRVRAGSTGEVTGQLFQVNEALDVVILLEPIVPADYDALPAPLRPPLQHSLRLLSLSQVQAVERIEADPPASPTLAAPRRELPLVRPVRVERLMRREQRALSKRRAEFGSRPPKGTSEEALGIFSALSKTYRCMAACACGL